MKPIDRICRAVRLCVIILLLQLGSWPPGFDAEAGKAAFDDGIIHNDGERIAQRALALHMQGNYQPSLEMREMVDSVLIPALLVQELLDENILPMYVPE